MRATVTRSEDDPSFAKHPTTLAVSKHQTHEAHIDVESIQEHAPPTETAVLCFQQVRTRLIIRLEFEHVGLCNQPAYLFIGKVNVLQSVFCNWIKSAPVLPAISRFQQRAAATCDPPAVLIEKVNPMQPGHGVRVLASPARAVGRRQKPEGSKQ